MPIKFAPTYKYDPGTNIYDTRYVFISLIMINLLSEKNRVPSWTDRIMYSCNRFVGENYGRVEVDASDHKPVFLTGSLEVLF